MATIDESLGGTAPKSEQRVLVVQTFDADGNILLGIRTFCGEGNVVLWCF